MTEGNVVLETRDVVRTFGTQPLLRLAAPTPLVRAVDGVTLQVPVHETVGLVGESGSGKSTLARLLLRLLNPTSGVVLFHGRDVRGFHGAELRAFRRAVQVVFQDPFGSLNPRLRVASLVGEPLLVQEGVRGSALRERVHTALDLVGLPADASDRYPSEFSGGQRQRIALARSLVNTPELVILDEPVSSLDVSVRSQVLNLLADLQEQLGVAYLLITHDLAVAQFLCRQIAVMYRGRIVETLPARDLSQRAQHPYTQLLLASVPPLDLGRLASDGGTPPASNTGCPFRNRCPQAVSVCAEVEPPLRPIAPGHAVACHLVAPA